MLRTVLQAAIPLALVLCLPGQAAAVDLSACGEIHIEASAQCEVEVGGGCKSMCEPLRFETVCTTKRYKVCKNKCQIEPPSVECTGSCTAGCSAKCEADPGSVECYASCNTDCMASCQAGCDASNCEATCKATCSTECDASCSVTPPSASCDAKCSASCDGSCQITAPYISCQVQCQEVELPDCETELKGGCEIECEQPEGALFCDGQYVDHGGKLRECIDQLNALLNSVVNVSASASLTSDCSDGLCSVSVEVEVGCGVAGQEPAETPWTLFAVFGALGAIIVLGSRRRR
jgi:hypothetical protein